MADKKPIVLNGGLQEQIQAADTLEVPALKIGTKTGVLYGVSGAVDAYSSLPLGVGPITTATWVDHGDGTATIGNFSAFIHSTTDFSGAIIQVSITGDTFTFVDGAEEYVVADYNSGTPIVRKETNKALINGSSIYAVRICWRQGTVVHSIDEGHFGYGLANKINRMIYSTGGYKRSVDGGLALSETATPTARTVVVSGALVFAAAEPILVGDFNSSTDSMIQVNKTAGNWVYTAVSVYDNTYYCDGTNLVEMGANKYSNRWIYRSVGDVKQVFYTLGLAEYNSVSLAQAASPPSPPILLRDHCILVGRITIQKSATSGVVQSAFDTLFAGASVINHNDTGNLNAGDYQHLTALQLIDAADIANEKTDGGRSGFVSWGGSGDYYSLDAAGTFTVLRAGIGRIKGYRVTWAGGEHAHLTANKGYYIGISATNTISATDVSTIASADIETYYNNLHSLFLNNTILFAVWYDGVENLVTKNPHPYEYVTDIAVHDHFRLGSVFLWTGAKIALLSAADRTIDSQGADLIDDHGVLGNIPDSTSTALSLVGVWRNNSGVAQRYRRRNFTVSGVTTAPTAGAVYTHNGSTYTVLFTNTGKTLIEAWISTMVNQPLASGALTKVSGTGDSTINFSAVTTNRVVPSSYLVTNNPVPLGTTGATRYGIYAIYTYLDDLQTPSTASPIPQRICLMSATTYGTAASAAASLGTGAGPTMTQFVMPTEIVALEPVLTGFVITDGSTRAIAAYTGSGFVLGVRSYKATPTSTFSGGAIAVTAAVNVQTDVTNFGNNLSSADTDVQKALDTLDDINILHKDVAAEISAIANKATPIAADMLLIEDSADTNKKKMITVGSLPAPASMGDVTGPASAVGDNFASYNLTTGKIIKDSGSKAADFAVAAKGVTNGDSHDHVSGDGAAITEAALSLSNNTTGNASTSAHGFLKILSNVATEFMNGAGNWVSNAVPSIASSAEAIAGTDDTKMITPLKIRNAFNAAGTAPVYAIRAWCSFDGTAADDLNGTYSQTATVITVTIADHDMIAGSVVRLNFTSGTAVDGSYVVQTVTSTSVFTITAIDSKSTSGNVTIYRDTLTIGSNVSSVTDIGTGDYRVNFTVAMEDGKYCSLQSGYSGLFKIGADYCSASSVSVTTTTSSSSSQGVATDMTPVFVAIVR